MDRRRRAPARGRRLRQPGRAPAEPPARLGDADAEQAPGRQRSAPVAALLGARLAAHPVAGARPRGPRAGGHDRVHRPGEEVERGIADPGEAGEPQDPAPAGAVHAGLRRHVRARVLAAGRECGAPLGPRAEPARVDPEDPGRPRHDLRPHRRPARDRGAEDDDLRRPPAGAQPARDRAVGARDSRHRTRTRSTRSCSTRRSSSSTSSGSPIPRRRSSSSRRGSRACSPTPRSCGRTRRMAWRRRCSATRASRITVSAGSSSSTTASSRAAPGRRRSCATRRAARST